MKTTRLEAHGRTVVIGGFEHEVVTAGPCMPGAVVRLRCGALYVVGVGRKAMPSGRCQGCGMGR